MDVCMATSQNRVDCDTAIETKDTSRPAVFTLDLGRAHTHMQKPHQHTYTHTHTHADADMLLSARSPQSSRAAWQTLGGVCYVGRVECLFPSTGGLDCSALSLTHTRTHTRTHTWFKVKGGAHTGWRGSDTGGVLMSFIWIQRALFSHSEGGKDCLPLPFCFEYVFFFPCPLATIHTCTHTPTRDIFV